MDLLEFNEVSYKYQSMAGEVDAISKLTFSVKRGEFIAIVGPSGCGKTTILSLISGLLKNTDGEILFEGGTEPPKNVGYMLQRDCLFEWRTIYQNAVLQLEVQKNLTRETSDYVKSLLEKYDLAEFMNAYPNELSGGMRQRVALIRTLATRPKMLLLDEPTSALDYQTRLNLCDDLYKIIESEKKTAILVTHDLSEAISLADRVLVLTKRPATIKNEYVVDFYAPTPLKRRENEKFPKLFEKIWKELNE